MFDIQLSLLGLYEARPDILGADVFHVPQGVDLDTLRTLILAESAELEILYPDPDAVKTVLSAWSTARSPSWERMYAALTEQYNALHNYDRTETETSTEEGTISTEEDISDESSGEGSTESTDRVTGYNTNTLSDNDKTVSSSQSSSQASRDRDELETRDLERSRTVRAYGNIGVTTSAQMLVGELDVRKTDIYRIIADEFINYFCLMIY